MGGKASSEMSHIQMVAKAEAMLKNKCLLDNAVLFHVEHFLFHVSFKALSPLLG